MISCQVVGTATPALLASTYTAWCATSGQLLCAVGPFQAYAAHLHVAPAAIALLQQSRPDTPACVDVYLTEVTA
jgi:hypothetical protein